METTSGDDIARLLLVEDNPGDIRLVEEAIKEAELTVEVHAVRDGSSAMDVVEGLSTTPRDSWPDLIILDLNLPRISGMEILSQIKQSSETSPIPTVVLTGTAAEDEITEAYSRGANAVITKPTAPSSYTDMINKMLQFWGIVAPPSQPPAD